MKKKWILIIVSTFFLFLFAFIFFVGYILSAEGTDYKEREAFCSKYIPLLNKHYNQYGKYPSRLNIVKKLEVDAKYTIEDCGYRKQEKSYSFSLQYGMGVSGYDSIKQEWWYD